MDQCLYLNCQDNSKVIHTSYMLSGVSWNFNCFFYCVRCEHLIHDDIGNSGDVGERKNCNGKRVWRANPSALRTSRLKCGDILNILDTCSEVFVAVQHWIDVQWYSLQHTMQCCPQPNLQLGNLTMQKRRVQTFSMVVLKWIDVQRRS